MAGRVLSGGLRLATGTTTRVRPRGDALTALALATASAAAISEQWSHAEGHHATTSKTTATMVATSTAGKGSALNDEFYGLFAATLTEFDADTGCVDVTNVPAYAAALKAGGCSGVFVNGTSGESMSLSEAERMMLAEAWAAACKTTGLKLILHIGCDSLESARALAAHAEALSGVDAIAGMAPSFFRPTSAAALVDFLAPVAAAAPGTPFFYYHFPTITNCTVNASEFFKVAKETGRIPTLAGMKYTHTDLYDYGLCCDLEPDMAFLPGYETMTLGFLPYHRRRGEYGAVGLSFSVAPELYNAMVAASGTDEASAYEKQIASRELFKVLGRHGGWTPCVKQILASQGLFRSSAMRAPNKGLSTSQAAALESDMRQLLEDPTGRALKGALCK